MAYISWVLWISADGLEIIFWDKTGYFEALGNHFGWTIPCPKTGISNRIQNTLLPVSNKHGHAFGGMEIEWLNILKRNWKFAKINNWKYGKKKINRQK